MNSSASSQTDFRKMVFTIFVGGVHFVNVKFPSAW